MTFLLGATWLALDVFLTEHGSLVAASALCGVTPTVARMRRAAV
ncbi:hypothetical protein [Geodermatophilus sp. SYSU D01119]